MLLYGDFEYVGICKSSTKCRTGKYICDPALLKFGMAVNIGSIDLFYYCYAN